MILQNKYRDFPEHNKLWVWNKVFAWMPVRVDDGRLVWLEYVMKTKTILGDIIYQTRKFPRDFAVRKQRAIKRGRA